MPIHHGIHVKYPTIRGKHFTTEDTMKFRYGIHSVFVALKMGPYLAGTPNAWTAAQLEHHFRNVCERFLFSLQHLNVLLPELLKTSGFGEPSPTSTRLKFEAECYADHILSYLNTIVDDVALAILLASNYPITKDADSMGKIKHPNVRDNPALACVRDLLLELDQSGSWWELAFKPKIGARQLLVHNQHLVHFEFTQSPDFPPTFWSLIRSPFAPISTPSFDFIGLLRGILSGLCNWLDRLQAALTIHLQTLHPTWTPPAWPHYLVLPVGYPPGETIFEEAYFPLPLCDGSEPLPWTMRLAFP